MAAPKSQRSTVIAFSSLFAAGIAMAMVMANEKQLEGKQARYRELVHHVTKPSGDHAK